MRILGINNAKFFRVLFLYEPKHTVKFSNLHYCSFNLLKICELPVLFSSTSMVKQILIHLYTNTSHYIQKNRIKRIVLPSQYYFKGTHTQLSFFYSRDFWLDQFFDWSYFLTRGSSCQIFRTWVIQLIKYLWKHNNIKNVSVEGIKA